MGIAEDLIIIILAGLLTGFIAHKLKLPLLLGYIIAGIFVGPFTGGISITNAHQIELLAEIGVALLLFSIGLDLSFKEIKEVGKIALIGTPIQIVLTIILGYFTGRFLNFTWTESVLLGAIMSLSSTMIVIKNLMSRGLMGTLSSRVMIGILIVQDLSAVPMMIMIPQMNNLEGGLNLLGITMLKGLAVLGVIIILGVKLMPPLLRQISKLESSELFLITITSLGLGLGFLTYKAGLSFALGSFVTGMLLNNSDYSHKALNDIIPLRDIFGLIFFTSIGMLIDPAILFNNVKTVFILVAIIIIGKFFIFMALSRIFGYFNIVPLAVGLGLSQVGEFSFVLARLGLNVNILSQDTYSIVLTASVVTMLLSPFLAMLTAPIYSMKNRIYKKEKIETINFPKKGLMDHVVIAGGGRVGRNVASILQEFNVNFVIIEQDFRRFEESKNSGYPVIYGDSEQESVINAAEIEKSKLLIITIPSIIVAREIASHSLKLRPDLKIIARIESLEDADDLYRMNIYELVQPEFEAGLEIIRQSLLHLNVPVNVIQNYTDNIRRNKYSMGSSGGWKLSGIKNASLLLELAWIQIPPGSPAAGRSIKEMTVRTSTGATIVGIQRGEEFIPNPDFSVIFKAEDIVAVIGKFEQRELFEKMVRRS